MAGKKGPNKKTAPAARKRKAGKKTNGKAKPARTTGGRHKLPTAPDPAEANRQMRKSKKKGDGALLVWLQDRTGKLHRMVHGEPIILRGGYIYPLPIRNLSEIKAADGRDCHRPEEDPKGLGYHYDKDAVALTPAELDAISVGELEAHREQLEVTLGKVRMEIDAISGPGTYNRLWNRGSKRHKLPNGKRVKRAGSEGSRAEVVKYYFQVVPAKNRTIAEIPDFIPPMPKAIEKLDGDPLFCPRCGELQPTLQALRKHDKVIHEQKTQRRKRASKYQDPIPANAHVFETETHFIGELLTPGGTQPVSDAAVD